MNFHFISDENGDYNFNAQDDGLGNPQYSGEIVSNQIMDYLNSMVSNNGPMNLYLGQNPPSVLAHNYSFILNDIFYHNDDYIYSQNQGNTLGGGGLNSSFGVDLGEVINVYWVYNPNQGGAVANTSGTRYVLIRGLWQGYEQAINDNNSPQSQFWRKAHQLNHELGHNLSLLHTIRTNNGHCSNTHDDECGDTPTIPEMIAINGTSPCCGWNTHNNPTCSNNLMDYGFGRVLSPEQLGRAHYTLSTNMIPYIYKDDFCKNEINDTHTIINGQSITWESIKILDKNLIIENGAELDIKCIVYMPKNSKIIVEPGGKLTINENGVVTTFCNDFWLGIEVHGDRNMRQIPLHQGVVEVRNGGVIEFARNGIRAIERTATGYNWNKTGGIVRIFEGTFKDCRRGIEFMSYQNILPGGFEANNVSFINNAEFITTDDYLSGTPHAGITLYNVNGVRIRNSVFENQQSDFKNLADNQRGSGIRSIEANYRATSNYSVFTGQPVLGTGNEFRNLYYGIIAYGGTGRSDVVIKDNLFEECIYGVGLMGANYGIIGRNTFNLASFSNNGNTGFGVYTDASYGFNIEGNTFNLGEIASFNHHATNINNSGNATSSGKVYRNTVNNIFVGTQTRGNNTALKVDCNTYNKGKFSSVDIHHATGVLSDQGNCNPLFFNVPASNNTFNGPCSSSTLAQVYKNPVATNFLYNYQENTLEELCHNIGANALLCDDAFENECPDELANNVITSKPITIDIWRTKLNLVKGELEDAQTKLASGNAESLYESIENDSPGDTKNVLLGASPYLSDQVLLDYLTQHPTPPAGHIQQILLANAPLTDTVMAFVNTLSLPNGISNQINSAQTGISERRRLEGTIGVLNTNRLIAVDAIVQEYLDTNWIDSTALFLQQEGSLEALCALVPIEVRRGDTIRAGEVIDTLRQIADEIEESEPECRITCELNEFCDFQQTVYRIAIREGGYFSMTPEERTLLETMADSDARIATNAQAILHFIDQTLPEYKGEVLIFPKSMTTNEEVDELIDNSKNDLFTIYPNPTSGNTVFTIELDEIDGLGIIITDLNGRVVKIMDVDAKEMEQNLEFSINGVYLVHLVENGKIQSTKKLVYAK